MTKRESKPQLTWTDVKAQLATFDRTALLDLLHHLYAAHKDNQAFLHARFGLGEDVLEPYKKTIDRWLGPDPFSQPGHIRLQSQAGHGPLQKSRGRSCRVSPN